MPANWEHPRNERGNYIPLYDGEFAADDAEWSEGYAQWQKGLRKAYGGDGQWEQIPDDERQTYRDYAGRRPDPCDYMPTWSEAEKTHFQMYETTSEGTPISPVMDTPEALARWLTDNNASAFGDMGATYEQWLRVSRGGWAPSAVLVDGCLKPGVALGADD